MRGLQLVAHEWLCLRWSLSVVEKGLKVVDEERKVGGVRVRGHTNGYMQVCLGKDESGNKVWLEGEARSRGRRVGFLGGVRTEERRPWSPALCTNGIQFFSITLVRQSGYTCPAGGRSISGASRCHSFCGPMALICTRRPGGVEQGVLMASISRTGQVGWWVVGGWVGVG